MGMNDNYSPGVHSGTFGAPWNDIEVEEYMVFTLECTLSYAIAGPCNHPDQKEDSKIDARREIISKMRIALENIDEVDNVVIE